MGQFVFKKNPGRVQRGVWQKTILFHVFFLLRNLPLWSCHIILSLNLFTSRQRREKIVWRSPTATSRASSPSDTGVAYTTAANTQSSENNIDIDFGAQLKSHKVIPFIPLKMTFNCLYSDTDWWYLCCWSVSRFRLAGCISQDTYLLFLK